MGARGCGVAGWEGSSFINALQTALKKELPKHMRACDACHAHAGAHAGAGRAGRGQQGRPCGQWRVVQACAGGCGRVLAARSVYICGCMRVLRKCVHAGPRSNAVAAPACGRVPCCCSCGRALQHTSAPAGKRQRRQQFRACTVGRASVCMCAGPCAAAAVGGVAAHACVRHPRGAEDAHARVCVLHRPSAARPVARVEVAWGCIWPPQCLE